jgi:hypothetical protein
MRDPDSRTVRELIAVLHAVDAELRAARCTADPELLTALIARKRLTLHALRRRRLQLSCVA